MVANKTTTNAISQNIMLVPPIAIKITLPNCQAFKIDTFLKLAKIDQNWVGTDSPNSWYNIYVT